jgi:hypothetical protein
VKRKSMRPAIFILIALALSAPTLMAVVSGSAPALSTGEHVGAAIVVARMAVSTVGYLVDSYRAHALAQRPGRHPQPE